MKRLTILLALFTFSCQEENVQPNPPSCDCQVTHQQMGAGGYWYDIYSEPYPQGNCDDDSLIINQSMMTRDFIACQ